jgi:hypothetical protein
MDAKHARALGDRDKKRWNGWYACGEHDGAGGVIDEGGVVRAEVVDTYGLERCKV